MELSKVAQLYYDSCFKDGYGVGIQVWHKDAEKKKIPLTEEVLDELLATGHIKVLFRGKSHTWLCGTDKNGQIQSSL